MSIPLSLFLVSIVEVNNYNNNDMAYFTTLSVVYIILLIICTIFLIRYFLKRKVRMAVISLIKKYREYNDGYKYFLMDSNKKKYDICAKIYNLLEGNEVIEVKIEDEDNIIQVLKIINKDRYTTNKKIIR
jgi:ABC-type multidrug transport system fused ATPase/permease subunit